MASEIGNGMDEGRFAGDSEGLRVLLVEDQALDAELALYELKQQGLEFSSMRVWREQEIRDALESFEPTVILSDYSMPGIDGLRVLEIARELASDIPFLFVSGTIGEERAAHALKNGAVDYVLKTNMGRLGPAVERALREAHDRRQRRMLEASRQRLAAILEATPDFVGICDVEMNLKYLNNGGQLLLGRPGGESREVSLSASDYLPADLRRILVQDAVAYARQFGTWQSEGSLVAADASHVPVSMRLIVHLDGLGEIEFVSLIARDTRERQSYESRIRYLANFDSLTDLPNRMLLQDRTAQAVHHCRRTGLPFALLYIDIDRFALVNESYGQDAGDMLLKEFASRLSFVVRERATVARLAADTFAVLDTEISRPDDALVLADALKTAIGQPVYFDGRELQISATVGIAVFPRDGASFEAIMRNAGAALHRGKEQARGSVQFYDAQMTDEAIQRIELEASVRNVLRRNELTLYYQPQIDIASGRIVGAEALLRWMHPKRGLLPPLQLVPVAEEIGVIHAIGLWVLKEACACAVSWQEQGFAPIRISVNVSPHQLQADGFVESVARTLHTSGLAPELLELEITESALLTDMADSARVLNELKALGLSIAIDDFGTGYSNLSYLSRLPIDRLKIDQSFVARMIEDTHDLGIVQVVISLARVLGLSVIAEGVETEQQLSCLASHGCQEAQGYLIARPQPPGDLAERLPKASSGA